jgi:hypothetical protein
MTRDAKDRLLLSSVPVTTLQLELGDRVRFRDGTTGTIEAIEVERDRAGNPCAFLHCRDRAVLFIAFAEDVTEKL